MKMAMTTPKEAATLLPMIWFEVVSGGLMFSGMVVVFWKFLRKERRCRELAVLAYQVDCDGRQSKQ